MVSQAMPDTTPMRNSMTAGRMCFVGVTAFLLVVMVFRYLLEPHHVASLRDLVSFLAQASPSSWFRRTLC